MLGAGFSNVLTTPPGLSPTALKPRLANYSNRPNPASCLYSPRAENDFHTGTFTSQFDGKEH